MASYDDDYTQIPDAESPDDIELGAIPTHTKSAEEIAAENATNDVPPGVHEFRVHSFANVKKDQPHMVKVRGRDASYHSHDMRIVMCLADDASAQIGDFFSFLSSADPDEAEAYYAGVPADKPNGKPGLAANKAFHFVGILAPDWKPGEPFPFSPFATMKQFPDGRPRTFLAEVLPGTGEYQAKDKDGKPQFDAEGKPVMKPGRAQLKMFSYRLKPEGWTPEAEPANAARLGHAANGHPTAAAARPNHSETPNGSRPAAPSAPAPAQAPPRRKALNSL